MNRLIFHIDVNSAFLSWEAVRRVNLGEPDIRTIPSAIGGDPNSRTGIITAKSIPAKKYGVTTGEPVSVAMRKCPELVVFPGDFDLYIQCSRAFKSICQSYTPCMESYSIDEVFLDMTGMGRLYPDPIALANEIKDRIYTELGFTVNVGISSNKLLAKMASDFEKPNKVHTLFPEEVSIKMWPLPVSDLFTCGKSSSAKLNSIGIRTIGDLANTPLSNLSSFLGERLATHLIEYANGLDDSPVESEKSAAKGFSAETTIEHDVVEITEAYNILLAQADVVTSRLRANNARCRCVAISYRTLDFKTSSHQAKLSDYSDLTSVVFNTAKKLIEDSWKGQPLRLIGLSLTDLSYDNYEQMTFLDTTQSEKLRKLDTTIDSIRTKYGNESVKRLSTMEFSSNINKKFQSESKIDNSSYF